MVIWVIAIGIIVVLMLSPGTLENIFSTFGKIEGFMKTEYDALYLKWGEAVGLDPNLIKAVAMTESDETPSAIGDGGYSFGLMQVQSSIGSAYAGVTGEALLDPEKNIEAGSRFLAYLVGKYGLDGGIQAYNLGETKYDKGYKSPNYLSKVMANYNKLTVTV